MKIVVFDLDETLGYFTQYGIFWDSLSNYLKNQKKTVLTQTDFDKNSKTYNIVGVSCSSKNSSVVVYPNPNNGIFTIQGLEIGAELILTDVLGKIIYKAITSELKTHLNLSNLSRGIYYLSANNELNRNEFKKIIIN